MLLWWSRDGSVAPFPDQSEHGRSFFNLGVSAERVHGFNNFPPAVYPPSPLPKNTGLCVLQFFYYDDSVPEFLHFFQQLINNGR